MDSYLNTKISDSHPTFLEPSQNHLDPIFNRNKNNNFQNQPNQPIKIQKIEHLDGDLNQHSRLPFIEISNRIEENIIVEENSNLTLVVDGYFGFQRKINS